MNLLRSPVILALAAVASACGDLGDDPEPIDLRAAALTGANMRPQPTSPTFGSAPTTGTMVFQMRDTDADYQLTLFNVDSFTVATLHIGGSAQTTPAVATLYDDPARPSGSGTLTARRLDAADIQGGLSIDSVLSAMRVGNAYVQVATKKLPNGAVRGQVLPVPSLPLPEKYSAALNGANERPTPVTTSATGNAHFEVTGGTARYFITVSSIDSVTAAHIHSGSSSVAGPIVVTLFDQPAGTGSVSGTLVNSTFGSGGVVGMTLDSLLVLMRTENAYVNVHTKRNPGGEIRGQLAPVAVLPAFP